MRIGFVGTGSMGNPIAANLLAAGNELLVHDLRPDAAANLVAAGATWCEELAQVAWDAQVVFLSLPSDEQVEEVCFGDGGLFSAILPGTYVIDLTTGSVTAVAWLVEAQLTYGIHYLSAPVSEGVSSAQAGQLSVFVGGDATDVETCRPVLECFASSIIHTGNQVSAMAAKLLTNWLWFVNAAAIGPALAIGAKAGIDLPVLREVVEHSCGNSWVAKHDIPSIYDGSYDPSFTTALCLKDLRLILQLGQMLGVPMDLGPAVGEVFTRAARYYGTDSPELSVVRYVQETAGVSLQTPAPVGSGGEGA